MELRAEIEQGIVCRLIFRGVPSETLAKTVGGLNL
jgi:hypothetical protein